LPSTCHADEGGIAVLRETPAGNAEIPLPVRWLVGSICNPFAKAHRLLNVSSPVGS